MLAGSSSIAGVVRSPFIAAVAAALVVLGAPVPTGAGAQQDAEPFIRIADISPWIDQQTPFHLTAQIANLGEIPLDDVIVSVAVHRRVITRSELRAALDFGPSGTPITIIEQAAEGPIPPGEPAVIQIERSLAGVITERGPHPLAITVRHSRGATVLPSVVSSFPATEAPPVNVAWLFRVDRPTTVRPDGSTDLSRLDELRLEELEQQLDALGAGPLLPITFAPSPATVETISRASSEGIDTAGSALAAMRRVALRAAEVATVPYAPASLPALVSSGLTTDLVRHITRGGATIQRELGREPTPAVLAPPGLTLDRGSIEAILPQGITGAVLAPSALRAGPTQPQHLEPGKFGPLFPVNVATGNGPMPALLPDGPIDERIEASTDGVLLAQAVVAETLGVWQELPLFAGERVITIAPDRLPAPASITALFEGLSTAPWVHLAPLSEMLAARDQETPALATAVRAEQDRPFLSAARVARNLLGTLTEVSIGAIEDQDSLERSILLAESDEWLTDPAAGIALADAAAARVSAIIGGIEVAPRRITLTSRTGDAPITILSTTPLRVRVRLAGAKLGFPNGDARIVELSEGDTTVAFLVEARATGAFPVDVLVETPNGRRVLASGRLVLRSTAVGAVSLIVVAGSALILLLAWVRRVIRKHKRRDVRASRAHPRVRTSPR